MKLLLISTLAFGLAAAMPGAWAQGDHHQAAGAPHPASGGMSSHPPPTPRAASPSPMHTRSATHTSARPRPSTHAGTTTHHAVHVVHRTVVHRTTTHRHVLSTAHRVATARHPRVDLARFRRTVVATRHFHAGPYRAPPGFRYRRWAIGERLPGVFFDRSYWLVDFGIYGLIAPPYGYVWVRYGPDAVLIDQYTGEVISVDFGLFL